MGMTSDHSQKDAFKGMHRHLLHNASASFSDAVVKLAAELIVVTRHCPNPKFRYVHPHKECLAMNTNSDTQPSDVFSNYE